MTGIRGRRHPQLSSGGSLAKILWGTGDNLTGFENISIAQDADSPLRMASQWYNGPGDTYVFGYTEPPSISNVYGAGHALQLIVWLADNPTYATSAQFLTDCEILADVVKGSGPNYGPGYVVLFTEVETMSADPAYFNTLRGAYRAAKDIFQADNPNCYVGVGLGGYSWSGQTTIDLSAWDDTLVNDSDFTAVQHMQAADNTNGPAGQNEIYENITHSVAQLSTYGHPVMISHMLLWEGGTGGPASVHNAWNTFRDTMLSDASLQTLANQGVFCWDLMNGGAALYLDSTDPNISPTQYAQTKAVLNRHRSDDLTLRPQPGHTRPPRFAAGVYLDGADSTTAAVPVPAGVAANDVILVHLYKDVSDTVTPPAGFTEITPAASVTAPFNHHLFWKRASGADTGTYSFGWTGSVLWRAAIATSYRGCVTSGSPIDVSNSAARSSSGATTPAVSVTTTGNDRLLVWCGADLNPAGTGVWTAPTGYRQRTTGTVNLNVATRYHKTAGTSGSVTGASTSGDQETAWLVALKPA